MNRVPELDLIDQLNPPDDSPKDNPLSFDIPKPKEEKKSLLLKLKSDKRLLLLAVLSAWIGLICLLSIAVFVYRLANRPSDSIKLIQTLPTATPAPIINDTQLPKEWKEKLDIIQKKIDKDEEFILPQFDQNIGL